MKSSATLRAGRLLAALLSAAALASADTIDVVSVDSGRGSSFWLSEDGSDVDAYFGGVLNIVLTRDAVQYLRDTLCVDLFTDIYIGRTYDTHVLDPYEVPGKHLNRVSWLIDNALLPEQGTYPSALPQGDWVTTPAQGAGIQFAIWDIVHDGGDGFSAGRVQAGSSSHPTDASILYWAQTYEALSAGRSSGLAFIYDNYVLGTNQQVQMLAGPMFLDGGPQPNPEPSTMVLVGFALIAVSLLCRRFRREGKFTPAEASLPKDRE